MGIFSEVSRPTDVATERRLAHQLQKKARNKTRYVLKTLTNFRWSGALSAQEGHAFWKARVPATRKHPCAASTGGRALSVEEEITPLDSMSTTRFAYRVLTQRLKGRGNCL